MDPNHNFSRKCRTLEGRYANHFAVGYNDNEFIFDFGQSFSEKDQAELCTRIITSPAFAKEFFKILKDAIDQYENSFGSME